MNLKTKIIVRKDTHANWIRYNPILYQGEICFDTTVGKCKIGDGQTSWTDLPYFALQLDVENRAIAYLRTKEEWNSNISLTAENGVIYIYTNYKTITQNNETKDIPGIKIGDGKSYLIDLPFITTYIQSTLIEHINNSNIHISQIDRDFWNNKITCSLDTDDEENLILTKNNI